MYVTFLRHLAYDNIVGTNVRENVMLLVKHVASQKHIPTSSTFRYCVISPVLFSHHLHFINDEAIPIFSLVAWYNENMTIWQSVYFVGINKFVIEKCSEIVHDLTRITIQFRIQIIILSFLFQATFGFPNIKFTWSGEIPYNKIDSVSGKFN